MHLSAKSAALGAAFVAVTACSQEQADQIVAGVAFGLAKETVLQNPAVQNSLSATPAAVTTFGEVRNSGAATYTGSVALYEDPNAVNNATTAALVDPDLMGRLDLSMNIGAAVGTMTGSVSNFVNETGQATDGALTISGGSVTESPTGVARLSGAIDGTLTGPTAAGRYEGGISGTFFDGDQNITIQARQPVPDPASRMFSLLGAAQRN